MKRSRPRKPLAERLESGLLESIRHVKEEIQLRTTVLSEPSPSATHADGIAIPAEKTPKPQ
jgi:hypothetical protein